MANNLGDYAASTVIYGKFTTYQPSTGAAFTLGGTPALSVYKDNSTTQSTTGVTLTADFDTVTGLNHFAIDTSADGTFYSAGSNFDIVITTGTVDSVSVVGSVVGSFSIAKTAALRPTTAGRTLDVASTGEAGIDLANINLAVGAVAPFGIVDNGTLQSATSTTAVIRSAASFADDAVIGATILITGGTGVGQARLITDYVGSTDTATVATWTTTPDNTSTYVIFGSAPSSGGGSLTAADVWAYATRELTALDEDNTTIDINNTAVGSVVGAVGSVTGNVGGNVTGSVGSVTGNVGGNVTGTVAGVTPATTASILTTALTESYAADGAAPTLSQAIFALQQFLQERAVSGTTLTVKRLDGSTTAMTFTLDDATSPTSITRAT